MSDRPSHQLSGTARKFLPNVDPLEGRLLLSRQVTFPDGSSYVFASNLHLPRTGGVALLSGTALTIGVGQSRGNTAQITADGLGGVQTEWNGGPAHSITDVQAILVQTNRARSNEVTFHLTTPRTSPAAVATGLVLTAPAVSARTLAHPMQALSLHELRTSGAAVQSGSVLTITLSAPRMNTVEMSSLNFGQEVQVEWNGGAVHDFSGVSTIIVDTTNGRKDLVALDTMSTTAP